MQANFAGFTFVDESTMEQQFGHRENNDIDRMDEDDKEEPDWDKHAGRGDRMSGVVPSNDQDIFHGNFDV